MSEIIFKDIRSIPEAFHHTDFADTFYLGVNEFPDRRTALSLLPG